MGKFLRRGKGDSYGMNQGKKMVLIVGGFFILMLCPEVQAKSVSPQDPLIQHLEFLGYECDSIESGIRAKHHSKIPLYITYAFGGIRLQTGFPGKPLQSESDSRYLVTNALMRELSVSQLFWSDTGSLFAMAWMPGPYEKTRFVIFMEAWDRDASRLRQAYDQLKPFLTVKASNSEKKS